MAIEPQAGDVVLVEPSTPLHQDPWPEMIKRLTKSKFSHSIVVLGPDRFADANPASDGGGDIRAWDRAKLESTLQKRRGFTLLRPTGPAADEQLLEAAFQRLCRQAHSGDPQVVFSDGACFALALLSGIQSAPVWMRGLDEVRRLRLAALWTMETYGESRLFCSEFVHRVLSEAGQQPQLPREPVVPVDDFPSEGLAGMSDEEFLRWIYQWLVKWLGLDEDSQLTIKETWEGIRKGYREQLEPERVQVANYFTPQDFLMSGSLQRIATRTPNDPAWVPAI